MKDVALTAIQGLAQENQDLQAQNAAQQNEIDALDARLTALAEGQGQSPNAFAFNTLPLWGIVGLLALWLVKRRQ